MTIFYVLVAAARSLSGRFFFSFCRKIGDKLNAFYCCVIGRIIPVYFCGLTARLKPEAKIQQSLNLWTASQKYWEKTNLIKYQITCNFQVAEEHPHRWLITLLISEILSLADWKILMRRLDTARSHMTADVSFWSASKVSLHQITSTSFYSNGSLNHIGSVFYQLFILQGHFKDTLYTCLDIEMNWRCLS